MKKSKTQQRIDEATANLRRDLGAYQEAFWCLRAGKTPVAFQSGEDESLVTVELLGADRASGGVVIFGPNAVYATDWLESARKSPDPYMRDLAHQIERAQSHAIDKPAAVSTEETVPLYSLARGDLFEVDGVRGMALGGIGVKREVAFCSPTVNAGMVVTIDGQTAVRRVPST